VDRVACGPTALLLKLGRQVPVIERQVGLDAARHQAVHQPLVEVESLGVEGARAGGLHTRPRHREAVRVDAQRADHVEVFGPAVVVVASHVAVAGVGNRAGYAAEAVPDGRTFAVLGRGALDLVGAGGDTPDEVTGKGGQDVGRDGERDGGFHGY